MASPWVPRLVADPDMPENVVRLSDGRSVVWVIIHEDESMLETVTEHELIGVLGLYDRIPVVREAIEAISRGTSVDRTMLKLLRQLLAERSQEAGVRRGEDRTYLERRID